VTFASVVLSRCDLSPLCAQMREISDKAETERALERCRLVGMPGFESGASSYFPQTWRLPEQLAEFKAYVKQRRVETKKGKRSPTFIVKPSGGSEGMGIVLVRHERNVPRYVVPTKPAVAQSYVTPLLMDGKKFDLRLYVLVRSVDPLEVYIHREGLARFCTEQCRDSYGGRTALSFFSDGFSDGLSALSCHVCLLSLWHATSADEAPNDDNLSKAYAHLTNYSLNVPPNRSNKMASSTLCCLLLLIDVCVRAPLARTEALRRLRAHDTKRR
jgi:hypothetical protein